MSNESRIFFAAGAAAATDEFATHLIALAAAGLTAAGPPPAAADEARADVYVGLPLPLGRYAGLKFRDVGADGVKAPGKDVKTELKIDVSAPAGAWALPPAAAAADDAARVPAFAKSKTKLVASPAGLPTPAATAAWLRSLGSPIAAATADAVDAATRASADGDGDAAAAVAWPASLPLVKVSKRRSAVVVASATLADAPCEVATVTAQTIRPGRAGGSGNGAARRFASLCVEGFPAAALASLHTAGWIAGAAATFPPPAPGDAATVAADVASARFASVCGYPELAALVAAAAAAAVAEPRL